MRKYLVAYNGADAGLGNRLRVVLGASILAGIEGRRLAYVWPTSPLFEPSFAELFDFTEGVGVPRWLSRSLAWKWPYVNELTSTWLTPTKRRQLVWQIRTGSEIELPAGAPHWGERLRALTPASDIAARVRTLFDSQLRGRPYVGVMIRAHAVSHQKTKDTSPVEWFVARMTEVREITPDVTFYVCCDVPEVQQQISDQFGNCVSQSDKGDYNTTAGVKSAVVDLYVLACSQFLIAPHFSSFLHVARHLAKNLIPFQTPVSAPSSAYGKFELGLVENPLEPWERAEPALG
jgi:hypothetical protein